MSETVSGGTQKAIATAQEIGKNIDIRPPCKDDLQIPVTVTDAKYDKEKALALAIHEAL